MMKKINKIISILLTVAMLMSAMTVVSYAEDVNTFPPQRPAVGNMKIVVDDSNTVTVGLRTNGTVNVKAKELTSFGNGIAPEVKNNVLGQTDVVDIACVSNTIVLLKSDGTVFVGYNEYYNGFKDLQILKDAASWTDIVAIDCGAYHLVGLKADGTVVAVGNNNQGQCDVMGWRDVSKIIANENSTLGIKKDGSVLATGQIENYSELRKLKNVKHLFECNGYQNSLNTDIFSEYVTNAYQALLSDGTITEQAKVKFFNDELLVDKEKQMAGAGTYDFPEEKILTIDKIFKELNTETEIISIEAWGRDYYILDSNHNLYCLVPEYYETKLTLLEENIDSFILANSDYYAVDKNGQILSNAAAFTSDDWILTTNITYNGNKIDSDVPPYVKDGRTLAPIRAILEALGMTVSWDGATQTAIAVKADVTISVTINSNIAIVNGEQKTLDVPAEITNGRTFVPVRFFAEALNMNVDWDGYTKTVIIESK